MHKFIFKRNKQSKVRPTHQQQRKHKAKRRDVMQSKAVEELKGHRSCLSTALSAFGSLLLCSLSYTLLASLPYIHTTPPRR